jgi:prepilin-type processing-associated H-X9-DG protein
MVTAAMMYADDNGYCFPMAYVTERNGSLRKYIAWDFTNVNDSGQKYIEPGLLWQGEMMEKIQQCPSFRGKANWMDDPYTGYNYNTSYIGGSCAIQDGVVLDGTVITSAKIINVRRPESCALFGDGQWSDGANKFMRSPFPGPHDEGFSGNWAGTQGYRHCGKTNVAFCDGHAESWKNLFTNTDSIGKGQLDRYNENHDVKIGFLSPDNSAYDLE